MTDTGRLAVAVERLYGALVRQARRRRGAEVDPPLTPTQLNIALTPANAYFLDRINQLDFKVQKNFKVNRFTVSPQLEVFNVNNSHAMISTVTNNQLSSSYRFANSIMQPRMVGVGAQVKW